jgi:hypothetical protein
MVARDGVEPRRQLFQCSRPELSDDSARLSSEHLPDFVLFIGAKMEPSCKNLSLPRFASISTSFVSNPELSEVCKREGSTAAITM